MAKDKGQKYHGVRREFFTKVDGKLTDAPMHEEILAGGDHQAATKIGVKYARKAGLTEEEIKRFYGGEQDDA